MNINASPNTNNESATAAPAGAGVEIVAVNLAATSTSPFSDAGDFDVGNGNQGDDTFDAEAPSGDDDECFTSNPNPMTNQPFICVSRSSCKSLLGGALVGLFLFALAAGSMSAVKNNRMASNSAAVVPSAKSTKTPRVTATSTKSSKAKSDKEGCLDNCIEAGTSICGVGIDELYPPFFGMRDARFDLINCPMACNAWNGVGQPLIIGYLSLFAKDAGFDLANAMGTVPISVGAGTGDDLYDSGNTIHVITDHVQGRITGSIATDDKVTVHIDNIIDMIYPSEGIEFRVVSCGSSSILNLEDEDGMILPPAYLIAPAPGHDHDHGPSHSHRLLSSAPDEVEVEVKEIGVEEVAFLELEDCDPGTLRNFDVTWHHYDELIKKNRKIATLARNIKEYAPKKQGIVDEDIIEQQVAEDSDAKDVDIKDVDQHFIPHHLIFTHKDNLLDCEVSLSEPSLHTMAHNVRDTIKAYRTVWGDDMEYSFLTDVECRDAIYEVEPELLAYYDDLQGMFKGDVCRSAILYLNGGYYFDVDLLVVHPFVASPTNKFVTVKWAWYEQDHQFFQAFIAVSPRNKIIKKSLTIMLEILKGIRAERGSLLGTQAMQDAWDEAAQEDASIQSQGKNKEVYLLSEHRHRLAEKPLLPQGKSYSKLPFITKDIGYTDGTCNYFVSDDDEESVYFFSHILGAEYCGKPLLPAPFARRLCHFNDCHSAAFAFITIGFRELILLTSFMGICLL